MRKMLARVFDYSLNGLTATAPLTEQAGACVMRDAGRGVRRTSHLAAIP
jgi:hypothetical protein